MQIDRCESALHRETFGKEGLNPVTQQVVTAQRRRVKVDRQLPMKGDYSALIRALLQR